MVMKFKSTDKIDQFDIINDNMIILPKTSVGNKIKYCTEILYTEITDDANFDYGKKLKKT